jgi:steroid delta-isomerase-like uncharacterized protein
MASKNAETFRKAHEAFNRRDFDTVVSFMTDDCVYHDRSRGQSFRGRAGFKEFMQGWATAFSDAAVTKVTYLDAGDTVIAEFTGTGVNDGPLGPLPSSGKSLNLAFCEIMRFNAEGKIVEGRLYYDQLTLLTQMGHAQQPAEAAAAAR